MRRLVLNGPRNLAGNVSVCGGRAGGQEQDESRRVFGLCALLPDTCRPFILRRFSLQNPPPKPPPPPLENENGSGRYSIIVLVVVIGRHGTVSGNGNRGGAVRPGPSLTTPPPEPPPKRTSDNTDTIVTPRRTFPCIGATRAPFREQPQSSQRLPHLPHLPHPLLGLWRPWRVRVNVALLKHHLLIRLRPFIAADSSPCLVSRLASSHRIPSHRIPSHTRTRSLSPQERTRTTTRRDDGEEDDLGTGTGLSGSPIPDQEVTAPRRQIRGRGLWLTCHYRFLLLLLLLVPDSFLVARWFVRLTTP